MSAKVEETFMRECLRLAKKGLGWTNPNPMVGAVIVKKGKIIGKGYHRRAGSPHAEIEALKSAGSRARSATLYTNLEPCCHFGRTPPCTDAIIRSGIRRVVCATRDPNPAARGGIEKLRRAGVTVSVGTLKDAALDLNETFYTFHTKQRPFVALKYAASLDGKLATRTGDSKWITNTRAREYARRLRGTYQAVVVGVETIIADNPHLGARTRGLPDPLRVILDSHLRTPVRARVLRDSHVVIATTRRAPISKKETLERSGVKVLTFGGEHIPPKELLASLRKMNIVSVLIEGGGAVLGSFVDAGIVDKVYAFSAPIIIGGEDAITIGGKGVSSISEALRLRTLKIERFGDNTLVVGSTA